MKHQSRLDENTLLWRKSITFRTSKTTDECLSILRQMDGATLLYSEVSVYIDEQNDGVRKFHIESRNRHVKGWIFGTIWQEDEVVVNGVAGVDPSIIFILLLVFAIVPIVYFSLSDPTIVSLIILLFIVLTAIFTLVRGGLMIRDALISELAMRIPQSVK